MIYPPFLKTNDNLGIVAISQGTGSKLNEYLISINNLAKHFNIIEAPSVRTNNIRANSAKQRAKELENMFKDPNIKAIICARGGYYAMEILPYINFEIIKAHPKLFIGYSNPTTIMHYITCKLDLATIYGFNASSFDEIHQFTNTAIDYITNNIYPQHNYEYHKAGYNSSTYDTPVKWQYFPSSIHIKGRCIGGCIDDLKNIIGTPYDATNDFINRYKNEGIIWYFDNYALSSAELYLSLLQFKYAGYFNFCKGIIIGRTCFPKLIENETYFDNLKQLFPNIPVIYDADIGHTSPRLTIINGAIMNIDVENDTQTISFELT